MCALPKDSAPPRRTRLVHTERFYTAHSRCLGVRRRAQRAPRVLSGDHGALSDDHATADRKCSITIPSPSDPACADGMRLHFTTFETEQNFDWVYICAPAFAHCVYV